MRLRTALLLTGFGSLALMLAGCGGSSSNNPPTPPAITIAFTTQPPSSLTAGAQASFNATVTNDSANAGVTWSVSCGSNTCGSFSTASTPSGMATTYTAPAIVPSGGTVTVTGTSVTDKTKTVTDMITITAAAPITVTLSPAPPSSLATNATSSLTAVVANDSANAGVKWTVTCGNSTCGSFNPTSTGSGVVTTYTAPATIPPGNTVTVTATSVTDSTKSASATITITTAPVGITVALSQAPPSSLTISKTASVTATVGNDTANAGVTWTVTCGSNSCGSFSATSTASGTATTYTAPGTIPSGGTVTVTATSVTDKTKTASATITITGLLADGTYVFHASGEDIFATSSGTFTSPYFIAGVFTVQGGVISGGEQDFIDTGYSNQNTVQVISASGSSLGKTSSGNLQVTLNTGDKNIGPNGSGVETLSGVAVSSTRVLINEFDTSASSTGSIDLQTSAAAPSNGYVFTFNGVDGNSNQYVFGMGGVLNISGTTISNTGSIYDCNDGLYTDTGLAFSPGSVGQPDSFGRVLFTLNPVPGSSSGCQLSQMTFAGYMNGNQIQLVETGTDTYGGTLGGIALAQGKNTGQFTPASINGQTYIFSASGADANGPLTLAGGFQFNGGGLAGPFALNDFYQVWGATTFTGGTYAVDPTGRVSMTGVSAAATSNSQPFSGLGFQLYLDGNGNALELGLDNSQVTTGMAYQQTSTALPTSGNFGMLGLGFVPYDQANDLAYWSSTGPITFSSSGFSGTFDYNLLGAGILFQGQALSPGQPLTATANTSTGTFSTADLDYNGYTDTFNYYPIDGSRVIAIETDGNQLGLLQIEPVK